MKIDRNKILLILSWCQNKFGKSKYRKDFPKLRVYKTSGIVTGNKLFGLKNGLFGYQGNNDVIIIFLGLHHSIKELCLTVVHEYKHYLMSEKEWNMLYNNLKITNREDAIYKHPHEIAATKFENLWGPVCYKELKNKLYKKL
jgi:hypothetical protein